MSKFFYNMFLRNRGGEGVVLFFMYLGFSLSHLSAICSVLPSVHLSVSCMLPLLGAPPFHISTSHSHPLIPHLGFLCLSGPYSTTLPFSSPSPHRHSILLVSLFVWHLFVLSFGSGLGLFFHTGTFLSLFSTLGMWILTCINPFLINIYVLIFMKLINFNFCLGLMKGCLPIRNITRTWYSSPYTWSLGLSFVFCPRWLSFQQTNNVTTFLCTTILSSVGVVQ